MRRIFTSPRRGMWVLAVVVILDLCGHPHVAVAQTQGGGTAARVADQRMRPQSSPQAPAPTSSRNIKIDTGVGDPYTPNGAALDPTGFLIDDSGSTNWEVFGPYDPLVP
jgi:hypothetical protein